jgi:hypothetical protein
LSEYIFRRIRGRIVPIGRKKQSEAKKGAAIVAAGVAVSASGGKAFKKVEGMVFRSEQRAKNAFISFSSKVKKGSQMTFDDLLRDQSAERIANKFIKKPALLSKTLPLIRKSSIFTGAALIGYGAGKVAKSLSNKKNENKAQNIGAVSGAAATIVFASALDPSIVLNSPKFKTFKVLKRIFK